MTSAYSVSYGFYRRNPDCDVLDTVTFRALAMSLESSFWQQRNLYRIHTFILFYPSFCVLGKAPQYVVEAAH